MIKRLVWGDDFLFGSIRPAHVMGRKRLVPGNYLLVIYGLTRLAASLAATFVWVSHGQIEHRPQVGIIAVRRYSTGPVVRV
jgi:hypothetical protein